MANIDIDPVSDHDKLDKAMSETIPLTPGGVIGGGSTWEPECKTSFRGKTQSTRLKEVQTEGLYQKLSESMGQTQMHFILTILNS